MANKINTQAFIARQCQEEKKELQQVLGELVYEVEKYEDAIFGEIHNDDVAHRLRTLLRTARTLSAIE